mmetsp:Transcript_3657/g.6686  ORF Transcript_3657/g.6686 Transcript_3657/m.6686 type:complete len:249 (+) Transcript_3657:835-1581(+)
MRRRLVHMPEETLRDLPDPLSVLLEGFSSPALPVFDVGGDGEVGEDGDSGEEGVEGRFSLEGDLPGAGGDLPVLDSRSLVVVDPLPLLAAVNFKFFIFPLLLSSCPAGFTAAASTITSAFSSFASTFSSFALLCFLPSSTSRERLSTLVCALSFCSLVRICFSLVSVRRISSPFWCRSARLCRRSIARAAISLILSGSPHRANVLVAAKAAITRRIIIILQEKDDVPRQYEMCVTVLVIIYRLIEKPG